MSLGVQSFFVVLVKAICLNENILMGTDSASGLFLDKSEDGKTRSLSEKYLYVLICQKNVKNMLCDRCFS